VLLGVVASGPDRHQLALAALEPLSAAAVRRLALLQIELTVALRTLLGHPVIVTPRVSVPSTGMGRVQRRHVRAAALAAALSVLAAAAVVALAARPERERANGRQPEPTSTTATAIVATTTTPVNSRPAAVDDDLTAALDAVWANTPSGCLSVSRRGAVLYDANGAAAVAPASAIKVITAAAALDVLGADARFVTRIRADAPVQDGRIAGDVWLVGGGDPVLGEAEWARATEQTGVFTSLDALADEVVAAGVRDISGRVVGDESRYDQQRYLDSWPAHFIDDGEIGPMSALSVNDSFRTWTHPGIPFRDPPAEAAARFRELLRERGVTVGGASTSGPAPSAGVDVASIESRPLRDLVGGMLRESDNGTAELLVKEIGYRRSGVGSTAAGAAAVQAALAERGLPVTGSTIADGSGLSALDRVSCALLASAVSSGPDALRVALPVAARDGTLRNRFVGTPVAGRLRAKTGSLDGVAALAGVAENVAGERIDFSYIVNGLPHGNSGRALQDAFAIAVVTSRG